MCRKSGDEKRETFTYYQDGTLKTSVSPSGKTIEYRYDTWGNLTEILHDGKLHTKRNYDAYGRLANSADTNGLTTYTWDNAGRLTNVKQGNKPLAYQYDEYGNLLTLTYPDRSRVEYTYDVMNRMASMKERTGQTVTYEYDTEGNLSAERRSEGISALYTYDALNRITSLENIREKKTASVLKSSARTEDAEGSAGGDGDSGEDEKEEEKKDIISGFYYTYDKSGRMVKEEATDPLGSLIKDYTYNDAGKLTEYKESRGEEVLLTTAYTYDTFGNKTEELTTSKKGSIRQISYTYDSADRLSVKKENGRTTASYAYDRDGNLIRKNESGKETVYTYTTDNRLATTTVNGVLESSVVYDGNGLKTFELLRKEYDRDVTKEEILLIQENEAALKKWKKYYKKTATEPETVEKQELTEQDAGRNYNPIAFYAAHTIGTLAPPLFEEWFDFARTFFDDLKEMLRRTWEEEEEALEGRRKAISRQIEEAGRTTLRQESIFSEETERYSYYEPTSYLYDLTLENAEVLAEYADTGTTARESYSYGVRGRSSSDKSGTYLYDGRGSVSSICKSGAVTTTLRRNHHHGSPGTGPDLCL